MAMALSIVRGEVDPSRLEALVAAYVAGIRAGTPPAIVATYLATGDGTSVAILTLWRDRSDLQAMATSGEEPFARRLIREAGGEPVVEFLDVAGSSELRPEA